MRTTVGLVAALMLTACGPATPPPAVGAPPSDSAPVQSDPPPAGPGTQPEPPAPPVDDYELDWSGGFSAETLAAEDFCEAYARAACVFDERCVPHRSLAPLPECIAHRRSGCEREFVDVGAALAGGRVTWDAAAAAQCVTSAWLPCALSPWPLNLHGHAMEFQLWRSPEACRRILLPAVAPGGACVRPVLLGVSADECAGGTCSFDRFAAADCPGPDCALVCPGTCVARPPGWLEDAGDVGEPCAILHECRGDLYCREGTCAPRSIPVGGACVGGGCVPGSACADGTCLPRGGAGEWCNNERQCQPGLWCRPPPPRFGEPPAPSTCVPLAGAGEACGDDVLDSGEWVEQSRCDFGLYCRILRGERLERGVCGPPPRRGEPCAWGAAHQNDRTGACGPGLRCVRSPEVELRGARLAEGTCQPRPRDGEPCSLEALGADEPRCWGAPLMCESAATEEIIWGLAGTCERRLAAAMEHCVRDEDCDGTASCTPYTVNPRCYPKARFTIRCTQDSSCMSGRCSASWEHVGSCAVTCAGEGAPTGRPVPWAE
jgi:hypothetical protein